MGMFLLRSGLRFSLRATEVPEREWGNGHFYLLYFKTYIFGIVLQFPKIWLEKMKGISFGLDGSSGLMWLGKCYLLFFLLLVLAFLR